MIIQTESKTLKTSLSFNLPLKSSINFTKTWKTCLPFKKP